MVIKTAEFIISNSDVDKCPKDQINQEKIQGNKSFSTRTKTPLNIRHNLLHYSIIQLSMGKLRISESESVRSLRKRKAQHCSIQCEIKCHWSKYQNRKVPES